MCSTNLARILAIAMYIADSAKCSAVTPLQCTCTAFYALPQLLRTCYSTIGIFLIYLSYYMCQKRSFTKLTELLYTLLTLVFYYERYFADLTTLLVVTAMIVCQVTYAFRCFINVILLYHMNYQVIYQHRIANFTSYQVIYLAYIADILTLYC